MWKRKLGMAYVYVCACVCAGPVVRLRHGSLKGTVQLSREGRPFYAFHGVPYAQPPVGPLRFHKPLPLDGRPWESERNCSLANSPCLQSKSTGQMFGSEDCLYLDVYTHKISNETLSPVLVYLHDGDFKKGWSQQHGPEYLLDTDIVLVVINYRLGVFGFLSLEKKELPGNNGLKDQRMALKWVQENIGQFGGDPSTVTLAGKGSGAACVHFHMLSPASTVLFARAIALSGSAYCPWAIHQQVGDAQVLGERFAAQLRCNHYAINDTLDCLRAMPAYVLQDIAHGMGDWITEPLLFRPTVEPSDADEPLLTNDPWQLTSNTPLIAGLTSTEGVSKVSSLDSAKIIDLNDNFEFYGPITLFFHPASDDAVHTALKVKKYYFLYGDMKPDNLEGLINMYSDAWFLNPIKEALKRHAGPKYLYYFDYKEENSLFPNSQGISPVDDLQYLFPLQTNSPVGMNVSREHMSVSEKLIEMLTNFVKNGNPTLATSEDPWKETSARSEYYHISNNGFRMEQGLHQERDDFWTELLYRDRFRSKKLTSVKDEL